jgi:hypothetical protein
MELTDREARLLRLLVRERAHGEALTAELRCRQMAVESAMGDRSFLMKYQSDAVPFMASLPATRTADTAEPAATGSVSYAAPGSRPRQFMMRATYEQGDAWAQEARRVGLSREEWIRRTLDKAVHAPAS